jgi:hypothetical protein
MGTVVRRNIPPAASVARVSDSNGNDERAPFTGGPSNECVSDVPTNHIQGPLRSYGAPFLGRDANPPLAPDDRPPTSLELLRQLEGVVRELFEISTGT